MNDTTWDKTRCVKDLAVLRCAIPNRQFCRLERREISDTETLNLFRILCLMLLTTILLAFREVESGIRNSSSKTPTVMPKDQEFSALTVLFIRGDTRALGPPN